MRKFIKPLGILFFLLMIASTPLLAQETPLDETKAKLYLWSLIIGGAVITIASSWSSGELTPKKESVLTLQGKIDEISYLHNPRHHHQKI